MPYPRVTALDNFLDRIVAPALRGSAMSRSMLNFESGGSVGEGFSYAT